jgi:hypothetical protein
MNLPRSRAARYSILAAAALAVALAAWFVWPTPRVDMAAYVPESAIAFVEIDSLPA